MTPHSFTIQPDDLRFAWQYLERKFALQPYWLESFDAYDSFTGLARDAITLSQWCQQWLDREQCKRLQAAVRAARHRRRCHDRPGREPPRHISLSQMAWLILSDLAKRDGVTFSEFIIQHHRQAWLDYEPPEDQVR